MSEVPKTEAEFSVGDEGQCMASCVPVHWRILSVCPDGTYATWYYTPGEIEKGELIQAVNPDYGIIID